MGFSLFPANRFALHSRNQTKQNQTYTKMLQLEINTNTNKNHSQLRSSLETYQARYCHCYIFTHYSDATEKMLLHRNFSLKSSTTANKKDWLVGWGLTAL